jgi:hypothetical protein
MVVFMFGRGNAVFVLMAIFVTKDTEIDVAAFHFLEVNLVGPMILGWNFLKQENLGYETSQDGIAKEESL